MNAADGQQKIYQLTLMSLLSLKHLLRLVRIGQRLSDDGHWEGLGHVLCRVGA